MAIERVDNWELVLHDADLDVNNRYKIEDSHIRCALIREIGTDSPDLVDFGLRDHPFIDIDTFIAPYYKSSNNLNVMRFSGKRGLKWTFTGFELPLPLDLELELNNLAGDYRVYMKGTLYKNVMSADAPINQYLMARLIQHSYKQLRPLYWRDITIPAGFAVGKEYVLDDVTDALVEWKPQDPKYTIAPSQNITYVIDNTIQVLWNDERAPPKDVEFRLKHNRIDIGAMPRLDHMFLPPADGITRYVEETLAIGSLDDCELAWTGGAANVTIGRGESAYKKEGTYSAKLTLEAGYTQAAAIIAYHTLPATVDISDFLMVGFWIMSDTERIVGDLEMHLSEETDGTKPNEKFILPHLKADEWTYVAGVLKAPAVDDAIASVALYDANQSDMASTIIYTDDLRALPLRVTHNPMEAFVKSTFTGGVGGVVSSVNYANGEIAITYTDIPTSLLAGYYAFRSGGGRDMFSLREIQQMYHRVTYPHKQSYTFTNKAALAPDGTKNLDLYTLAEYYQLIPPGQDISPGVFAAARALLV